jgi:type IV secretion system protein VirB11
MTSLMHVKKYVLNLLEKGQLPSLSQVNSYIHSYIVEDDLIADLNQWYSRICSFRLFLEFDSFEEIIFDDYKTIVQTRPKQIKYELDLEQIDFQIILLTLCIKHHIEWNTSNPFKSFSICLDGRNFRVSLLHECLSPTHGSKIFLRTIGKESIGLEHFEIEPQKVRQIQNLVKTKKNILICGSTGSGKTSFMNACLKNINNKDHLVILEDTHEIKIGHNLTTRLIPPESSDIELRDMLVHSLRMTPDRIILGEMRSNEVETFILAMNTGHKGMMSTIHANCAVDSVERIAMLFCMYSKSEHIPYTQIKKMICNNIDYIIYLENKKLIDIIEVIGAEEQSVIYQKVA